MRLVLSVAIAGLLYLLIVQVAHAADCGEVRRDVRSAYSITSNGGCQHAREVVARFIQKKVAGGKATIGHSTFDHRCSWKKRECRYWPKGKERTIRWSWTVPYRTALASWYDAVGLGGRMGCAPFTYQGGYVVAHKSLPCGTRLEVCFRGCVEVYVGDRGPYVGAREFDLDKPVRDAIGFTGVQVIRVRELP